MENIDFVVFSVAFSKTRQDLYPTFVQIHTFLPTFGQKSINFCPNLWFFAYFWTKIKKKTVHRYAPLRSV